MDVVSTIVADTYLFTAQQQSLTVHWLLLKAACQVMAAHYQCTRGMLVHSLFYFTYHIWRITPRAWDPLVRVVARARDPLVRVAARAWDPPIRVAPRARDWALCNYYSSNQWHDIVHCRTWYAAAKWWRTLRHFVKECTWQFSIQTQTLQL